MSNIKLFIARILVVAFILTQIVNIPIANAENSNSNTQETKKIKISSLIKYNNKSDIIVKYKNEVKNAKLHDFVKTKLKLKKLNQKFNFKSQRINVLEIDPTDNINSVIAELKKDSNVEYAQPNYPLSVSTAPSDEKFVYQWGLSNSGQEVEGKIGRVLTTSAVGVDINAINAWNLTTGNDKVVVGVLDSGIDVNHTDLKDSIYVNAKEIPDNGIDDDGNGYIDDINGWDFANDDKTVYDSPETDIHGTYVAGVIAAKQDSKGITGVAPNIKIMPLKFISGTTGYTCDALKAIEYAKNMGVKIINCSFGGTDNNTALKDAMQNSGMLFVCAAGNRGGDSQVLPVYPASFNLPNIISVASIDNMGILAPFSNRGRTVDVAAPGTNILSTIPGDSYDYYGGTSVSTAFVSGIAGLISSSIPNCTIADIKDRIINNVTKCTALENVIASEGRVDAYGALTNTPQPKDTYNGAGAGDDVLINSGEGSSDTWYTLDQLAKIKEKLHYGESGVNPASGNYSMTCIDMSIPAPGFQVNLSRTYNSRDEKDSILGRGWTFGFYGKSEGTDLVEITLPDGSANRFRKDGSYYKPDDTRASYIRNTDGSGILTTKDQYQYGFDTSGKMIWMADKNGNKLTISYSSNNKIDYITDTVGRQYKLTYNDSGLLDNVTDSEQRVVRYEYENSLLKRVIDPNGGMMQYGYDDQKYLITITDANNHLMQTLEYSRAAGDGQNKICKTKDSYGDTCTYNYDMTNRKTTITNSENRKWTYWFDLAMFTTKVQDPEGLCETTQYTFENGRNVYGDVLAKVDRNGNRTSFDYDSRGNIIKTTNPDMSVKTSEYDVKNNLIKEVDEIGNKTFYIYDIDKVKLLEKVQPLNGTDEYVDGTSDISKFAITKYEYYPKADAKTKFGCDVDGLLKTTTDPAGIRTTYEYNQYGDIVKIIDGNGIATEYIYNKIGWKLSEKTPNGNTFSYRYDKNGTIIATTNPDTGVKRTVYDKAGYKLKEVNPEQYESTKDNLETNTYTGIKATISEWNDNGTQKAMIDAEGNRTEYTWDIYGNMKTETKPNGAIYRYEYDVLNRQTKVYFKESSSATEVLLFENSYGILPNGNAQKTETQYLNSNEKAVTVTISDYEGRVVEKQFPDGTKTKNIYNADGTVNTSINQNGATTKYKYDGLGNVSDVWKAVSVVQGNTKYSWNSYTYDAAGKKLTEKLCKQLVDINGTTGEVYTKSFEYDTNGRLSTQTDSDGKKTIYNYDGDGNISKQIKYIDNTNTDITETIYNYLKKPVELKQYVRRGDLEGNSFEDNTTTYLCTRYAYDKNGNISSKTYPDGTITRFTYDNLDRELTQSYPVQNEVGQTVDVITSKTYTWDGKVKSETKEHTADEVNVKSVAYEYDASGNLIKEIDEKNNVTLMQYDLGGRKIAEVLPGNIISGAPITDMQRTEYTYDLMDRVKTKTLIYKNQTLDNTFNWGDNWTNVVINAYQYDNLGNVTKTLDALGYKAGTGSTVDEKISTGYGIQNKYNLDGKLEFTLDAVSNEKGLGYTIKYTYNGLGQKASEIYCDGTINTYTYDGSDNMLAVFVNGKQKSSIEYDLLGREIRSTDGMGNVTTKQWNNFGKLAKEIAPGDSTIPSDTAIYQYDTSGNLVYTKNTLGVVHKYTYDTQNRQLSHTIQNETGTITKTTSSKYDIYGNKRFETDGNGNVTERRYNELEQLVSVTKTVNGKEKTTSYSYDANGNKISQTNYLGKTTSYKYDGINRLIETTDATGAIVSQIEYNEANVQKSFYDAVHNETRFVYDSNLRQIGKIDAQGHVTTQNYDARGNLAKKVDGKNNVTTYTYDAENRLQSVINSLGEVTTYTYDNNGNNLTQTDGKGNTITYEYNAVNKLIKKIDPNGTGKPGRTELYTYNSDESLATKKDRNGNTTIYTYDIFGNLINENVAGDQQSYTYDSNGNQLTMTNAEGTTVRTYDEENRVTSKTVPVIGTTKYLYDSIVPNPTTETGIVVERTTDPKGNITEKGFDAVGRLVAVTTEGKTTNYTYYANGNRESVKYPDGTVEKYEYNKDNKVVLLQNKKADGSILQSYSYTYDEAENQTSKTETVAGVDKGTTSYKYDSLNRLKEVTEPTGKVTNYTFDKAGNRLTESVTVGTEVVNTTYTYNEQNRLTLTETASTGKLEKTIYVYDNNGNLKSKSKSTLTAKKSGGTSSSAGVTGSSTEITSGGTTVKQPEFNIVKGSSDATKDMTLYTYDNYDRLIKLVQGGTTSKYAYDPDDYRTSKTINGKLTRYLYDEDKVVLETDGTGNETARNVYGTNLLYRAAAVNGTAPAEQYYYMYNAHGDVTALLDTSGKIAVTYEYDSFGNITQQTGAANNSITYAGYQYDKETDLYYLNARYYDSKIARFMSEDTYTGDPNDPLSLNLYTYCANEPLMYDDPTGHKANRVLDYGDKGDMVKAIQEKLLGLDYSLGGYKATGNFAGCTQSAVKEFQKDYGLPVTGVVDNRTMNVLCSAYSLRNDNDHQKVYNQIELVKKNSKAGDIPGEAILLSQGNYEKTIKNITTAKNSTSDPKNTVVHTKVVNNEVKVVSVEKKETNQTKPVNGTGKTGTSQVTGNANINEAAKTPDTYTEKNGIKTPTSNLPTKGVPNSTEKLYNPDGTVKQERKYGPDGKAEKDTDYNHDGNEHEFPHEHDWDWEKNPPRQGWNPVPKEDTSSIVSNVGKAAGLATVGTVLYWVVSEGLRIVFPPRNFVPVP